MTLAFIICLDRQTAIEDYQKALVNIRKTSANAIASLLENSNLVFIKIASLLAVSIPLCFSDKTKSIFQAGECLR